MSAVKEDTVYDGLVSPSAQAEDVEQGTKRGASIIMLTLVSTPRIATQMAWAAQWAALGPYLGTMLPKFAVQLTQLIGPLVGIVVAPTVGVCSDRSTNSWGRRRPFLLYSAITSVICWIGMAFTRKIAEGLGDHGDRETGSRKWTAFFTIIFYAWMDITVNVAQTPAQLLIADFAGDRQTLGAGIGQAWSTFGAIVVSAYISWFGPAHQTLGAFLTVLCAFMLVTVGTACIAAKEEPLKTDDSGMSKGAQICDAFKAIGRGLKRLPPVLMVYCVVFFCIVYGYTAYNGNKGQYFGLEVKGGNADGADNCNPCSPAQKAYNRGVQIAGGTTELSYNIAGYVFSWILPLIVTKIGAKWTLTLSLIPQILLIGMSVCKVVWVDVLFVVIITIPQVTIYALVVPLIIHVIGDKEDIGIFVGAVNSASCLGQLLNFLVGSALVEMSMGYRLPVLVGGIVSAVGFFIALIFFKVKMYSL